MNLLVKFRAIGEYVQLMGIRWFLFRLKYEFFKKINYFGYVNQRIIKKVEGLDRELFFYETFGLVNENFEGDEASLEKADKAIEGNIYAFSNQYLDYNDNGAVNWQRNPISKVSADGGLSWNSLPDFGKYGDIKLIWEASRFPQVYYFINAYSITNDEKYAYACVTQIREWIKANPYPKGVNYKCGQEISFRVFSWLMALEYFRNFITKDDQTVIVKNIYVSLLRVDANIDYAAKSIKNNHSISEAAGIFIGGLLFPQFPESKKLVQKGLRYLLKETSYQVYSDGSYIQHSFTYQRLALDVLSLLMIVAKKKDFLLPNKLQQGHNSMIEFLNSFIQSNGWLPNYGSNDGANLFPLTEDNYRDFRGSLDLACMVNNGYALFDNYSKGIVFFGLQNNHLGELKKQVKFRDGGYYILKNSNIFSFIRCHSYRDRPASNDMFHLDVWYKGQNILCDTGSYSYNTDKEFKNNLTGTIGHNTVMINKTNQMKQVLNFGYSNWTKAKCLMSDEKYFKGINYAYQKRFGIFQKREVILEENRLIVVDSINNISTQTNIQQIWNTKCSLEQIDSYTLKVKNCTIVFNVSVRIEKGYVSDYYNTYKESQRIICEIDTGSDIEIKMIMEFD